jgi:LPXTG-site transpeptidase (sortase) family protein
MLEPTVRRRYDKVSLALLGAAGASFIALVVLVILILTGTFDSGNGNSVPETVTGFTITPQQPEPTALPRPTSRAPITRLVIPRFEVDAPVVIKGIDANNVMEAPEGPEEVAWYDFTQRPGNGGNAVFSGHVDYINYGPAVFANLYQLEPNDIIDIALQDGTRFRYRVSHMEQVPADTDVSGIVGPSDNEIVTLITCTGTFDSGSGQYSDRLIIQAGLVRTFPAGDASASAR